MEKFRNKYRVPSTRWQNWNYGSDAAYYVTICTKQHVCYFGNVVCIPEKTMQYTEIGSIACQYWCDIPEHFPFVELDVFVVMPNHVHGIVIINKTCENAVETQDLASLHAPLHTPPQTPQNSINQFGPQSRNLASIIRGYKTGVKKYATLHHIDFTWQSRFHDRVIRDYAEYLAIKNYIDNNIEKWNPDSRDEF